MKFNNKVIIKIYEDKKLIKTIVKKNLVVLIGRNLVRDFINLGTLDPLIAFALGTGVTPPAASDSALETSIWSDVFTKRTPEDAKLTYEYFVASNMLNGNDISEAGLFTNTGKLFARITFEPITKVATIQVVFTWIIEIEEG